MKARAFFFGCSNKLAMQLSTIIQEVRMLMLALGNQRLKAYVPKQESRSCTCCCRRVHRQKIFLQSAGNEKLDDSNLGSSFL